MSIRGALNKIKSTGRGMASAAGDRINQGRAAVRQGVDTVRTNAPIAAGGASRAVRGASVPGDQLRNLADKVDMAGASALRQNLVRAGAAGPGAKAGFASGRSAASTGRAGIRQVRGLVGGVKGGIAGGRAAFEGAIPASTRTQALAGRGLRGLAGGVDAAMRNPGRTAAGLAGGGLAIGAGGGYASGRRKTSAVLMPFASHVLGEDGQWYELD